MAFRWRDDDGPTLIAGLVTLYFFSGDPDQYCLENLYFCDLSGRGLDPLSPLWILACHQFTCIVLFTGKIKRNLSDIDDNRVASGLFSIDFHIDVCSKFQEYEGRRSQDIPRIIL